MMNTVILMWNPSFSSYKMTQFEEELEGFLNEDVWFNWSVYDWQNSHDGDRFFLVRVGQGNTGIVMSGYFSSDPYRDEDWAGKKESFIIRIWNRMLSSIRTKYLLYLLPS